MTKTFSKRRNKDDLQCRQQKDKNTNKSFKKENLNKNGKTKLAGPLIFRKTNISYSKVCQQGTGGSDSGHQAAGTAAAQPN